MKKTNKQKPTWNLSVHPAPLWVWLSDQPVSLSFRNGRVEGFLPQTGLGGYLTECEQYSAPRSMDVQWLLQSQTSKFTHNIGALLLGKNHGTVNVGQESFLHLYLSDLTEYYMSIVFTHTHTHPRHNRL